MNTLSDDDFNFADNLKINNPGIFVVYFKQSDCSGCREFDPIFLNIEAKKHEQGFSNANFGVLNLSTSPKTLKYIISNKELKIDSTPHISIFYKTVPYANYSGPKNVESFYIGLKNMFDKKTQSVTFLNQQPKKNYSTFNYTLGTNTNPLNNNLVNVQKPLHVQGLRNNNVSLDVYADDNETGYYDTWDFRPPKNKHWYKDLKEMFK